MKFWIQTTTGAKTRILTFLIMLSTLCIYANAIESETFFKFNYLPFNRKLETYNLFLTTYIYLYKICLVVVFRLEFNRNKHTLHNHINTRNSKHESIVTIHFQIIYHFTKHFLNMLMKKYKLLFQ